MENKTATTVKPAGIGDTHKAEVRLRVIEQAMRMFQAHGIKSVTMDSIADALKMSKRTLYELFADKAALLLAGLRLQDERKERCMQERLAETDNVLEIILGEFADSMRMFSGINPDFFIELHKYPAAVAYFEKRSREHEAAAVAFLQRGVAQGFFRADVNFTLVYRQIARTLNYRAMEEIGRGCPLKSLFYNIVIVYIRGCATPEGARYMDNILEKILQAEQL